MNLLYMEMGVGYDQHGYVLHAHLAFSLLLDYFFMNTHLSDFNIES